MYLIQVLLGILNNSSIIWLPLLPGFLKRASSFLVTGKRTDLRKPLNKIEDDALTVQHNRLRGPELEYG